MENIGLVFCTLNQMVCYYVGECIEKYYSNEFEVNRIKNNFFREKLKSTLNYWFSSFTSSYYVFFLKIKITAFIIRSSVV